MYFKERGARIQVYRYDGYDAEKRQSKYKHAGSLARYSLEPVGDWLKTLSAEELAEVNTWIADRRQKSDDRRKERSIRELPYDIKRLTETVRADGLEASTEWGLEVWSAIEQLTKALKAAGVKKPPRAPRKAAEAHLPGQQALEL